MKADRQPSDLTINQILDAYKISREDFEKFMNEILADTKKTLYSGVFARCKPEIENNYFPHFVYMIFSCLINLVGNAIIDISHTDIAVFDHNLNRFKETLDEWRESYANNCKSKMN